MVMAPVLKWPGAKWKQADWIISHIPKHITYLEPFFGGGAVFFRKPPSPVETINDLDGEVCNLFRVIRDHPDELAVLIEMTPWARDEYDASFIRTDEPIEAARRFIVRSGQAFGNITIRKTGWKVDVQGRNEYGGSCPQPWAKLPKDILAMAKRLKKAQIENRPAVDLIKNYRYPKVAIYADPPYPMSTRTTAQYPCEMTDQDHVDLLELLLQHPGAVLLSSYPNEMYEHHLKGWTSLTKASVAEMGAMRTEVLWLNPVCVERLQMPLFERSDDIAGI